MRKWLAIAMAVMALSLSQCGGQPEEGYVKVMVRADRNVVLEGADINPQELTGKLREEARKVPEETVGKIPVSTLGILTETKGDVRYEQLMHVLDACSKWCVRRTYFSHPEVNGGEEVELWLPVGLSAQAGSGRLIEKPLIIERDETEGRLIIRDGKPDKGKGPREATVITGREWEEGKRPSSADVLIRLLWVDRGNPEKRLTPKEDPEGSEGTVLMKIGESTVMKDNKPDWKLLEQRVKSAGGKTPFSVEIRPMKKVLFADVLKCALVCKNAGAGSVALGVGGISSR